MDKKITQIIEKLSKKHGKEVIRNFGSKIEGVGFQTTGIMSLDNVLGGGLAVGRIIEMWGVNSAGKTTMAMQMAKAFQDSGKVVAYIDLENAVSPQYANELGLNMKDLIFSQPEYGEQALEIIDVLVDSDSVDFIIVDSVANLMPKAELEGNIGDANMGKLPKLLAQAMRRLTPRIAKNKTTLLFINQVRDNIGSFSFSPYKTTGGHALMFAASQRIQIARKSNLVNSKKEAVGIRVVAKIVKNKVATPFQSCEMDLVFGEGFSLATDLLEISVSKKIIKVSGRTYSLGDEILGTSKNDALKTIKDDVKLQNRLKSEIKKLDNT